MAAIWGITIPGFEIDTVMSGEKQWTVSARTIADSGTCPECQQRSRHVHKYYLRTLRDLPVDNRSVQLVLQVRRFKCLNQDCSMKTFAERLTGLAEVYGQRTIRFTSALKAIGHAVSGEAGAKLARRLGLPTSGDTLLRVVHRAAEPVNVTPRVVGVDDWAFRRGQVYGTILIDLERHCPVDLLEGRTAGGLAQWLKTHPGVEIMTRDRSTEFARGMNEGNAHAMQVADRWHLLQNCREALERMFKRIRPELGQLSALPDTAVVDGVSIFDQLTRRAPSEEKKKAESRAQRQARFDQIKALQQQGVNILQAARQLKISRGTIRAIFHTDEFPAPGLHRRHTSILDPYVHELKTLIDAGNHNVLDLWRKIKAKGYVGSQKPVRKWVRLRREAPAATTPVKYLSSATPLTRSSTLDLPSAKSMSWLLVRHRDKLSEADVAILKHIQQHTCVQKAYALAEHFGKMIREHLHAQLEDWIVACEKSVIPDLASFATGLRLDFGAIFSALKTGWSNGQTEGQVNRLKMIKRSMYGRASFKLLRLKVLARAT
jgi:transposase